MKYTIILLYLCLNQLSYASDLPREWFVLPEDDTSTEINKEFFSSNRFEKSFENILKFQEDSLNKVTEKHDKKSAWYLDGVNTSLGLGFSGKIGLKSWGGNSVVELFWHRKNKESNEENNSSMQSLSFNSDMSKEDVEDSLSPLIKGIEDSKKVKFSSKVKNEILEKALAFSKIVKAASQSTTPKWTPSKLRLDITLGLSGSTGGVFLSVGGDIRIRFEWKPSSESLGPRMELSEDESKISHFIKNFSTAALSEVEEKDIESDTLSLSYVRIGFGFSAKGSIGVLKGSAGIAPYLYLKPNKEENAYYDLSQEEDINLLVENPSSEMFNFAGRNQISKSTDKNHGIFKLKKRKVKKGVKKAFKFARKMSKTINKFNDPKKSWGIKKIRSSYSFSISGTTGVTTLKGTPSLELEFKNTKF